MSTQTETNRLLYKIEAHLGSLDATQREVASRGIGALPLPGPTINAYSLGTAAVKLYAMRADRVIDFFIENLSANTVTLLQYENQPAAQGIQVAANANISDEDWTGDLIVVASGLASDIRYSIKIHGYGWDVISGGDNTP
jgi:hypothetical protein